MHGRGPKAAAAMWSFIPHVVANITEGCGEGRALEWLQTIAPATLATTLARHGLQTLWWEAVRAGGMADAVPPDLAATLRNARRLDIARTMAGDVAMEVVRVALDQAGVTWLVFKGFATARTLYPRAHLRPMLDIDLLVAASQRQRAWAALHAAGFREHPQPGTLAHQRNLIGHGVTLDLHWEVLRPGRARGSLADLLLESRRAVPWGWRASDAAEGATLALHPAVTDYVSGRLIGAYDLHRWWATHHGTPAAERAVAIMASSGLGFAGWAMLRWTQRWFATPLPADGLARLAPGRLRRAYLAGWLARDPAAIYKRFPTLARLGFSLALQQTPRDIARALWLHARAVPSQIPLPTSSSSTTAKRSSGEKGLARKA